jgi:hypothetical protein
MTTVLLAVACFTVGPLCIASRSRAVCAFGCACVLAGAFLWLGLDVLCGDGPLRDCAVVQ